jgi:hypothetical protein
MVAGQAVGFDIHSIGRRVDTLPAAPIAAPLLKEVKKNSSSAIPFIVRIHFGVQS